MFHIDAQRGGRVVPPEAVRDVGHGEINAGREVLRKFVQLVRSRKCTARRKNDLRSSANGEGNGELTDETRHVVDSSYDLAGRWPSADAAN